MDVKTRRYCCHHAYACSQIHYCSFFRRALECRINYYRCRYPFFLGKWQYSHSYFVNSWWKVSFMCQCHMTVTVTITIFHSPEFCSYCRYRSDDAKCSRNLICTGCGCDSNVGGDELTSDQRALRTQRKGAFWYFLRKIHFYRYFLRAACLQNETAPKSFNFKTKNGPKNDPKLPRKILSLVLLCRISHRHYSKLFHREFPHKIKYFFTTRICRHGHANTFKDTKT